MSNSRPSLVAPLTGVVMGVGVFVGVNVVSGRAVIPTAESVQNISHGLSAPAYRMPEATAAGGAAAGGAYQTVCQACHQADGNGLPGAFPPLAGSEWANGDPETPIRIVLLGLTGAIEVKGSKFNATMPPPPGMTDEKIAEAISHVRTHFGNNSGAIDVELVKKVRASLAGRTTSWSSTELTALRSAAAVPAAGAAGGPAEAPPAEPAAAPAAAPAAKRVRAPKPAATAPAAAPAPAPAKAP
jgi:mono/diheme cytochrome c family protein